MLMSENDKLYAQIFLEELKSGKTSLGIALAQTIKGDMDIPNELKESLIAWVGSKEADLAHERTAKRMLHYRYDAKTDTVTKQKSWWRK